MSEIQRPSEEKPRLLIDFVADPVCPWCYVGLRSLFAARDLLAAQYDVVIRFRAYQLNPDTPLEGVDREAYYDKKFPDKDFRAKMRGALMDAAKEAGFEFDPARPKHLPNTLRAHQLMRWAQLKGDHEAAALALYEAFWEFNADLGDGETLAAIARDSGLDGVEIREKLKDSDDSETVAREAEAFKAAGVSGVPTYIINAHAGFSGAMAPDKLASAIELASKQSNAT